VEKQSNTLKGVFDDEEGVVDGEGVCEGGKGGEDMVELGDSGPAVRDW
jgi:hypothetical protein